MSEAVTRIFNTEYLLKQITQDSKPILPKDYATKEIGDILDHLNFNTMMDKNAFKFTLCTSEEKPELKSDLASRVRQLFESGNSLEAIFISILFDYKVLKGSEITVLNERIDTVSDDQIKELFIIFQATMFHYILTGSIFIKNKDECSRVLITFLTTNRLKLTTFFETTKGLENSMLGTVLSIFIVPLIGKFMNKEVFRNRMTLGVAGHRLAKILFSIVKQGGNKTGQTKIFLDAFKFLEEISKGKIFLALHPGFRINALREKGSFSKIIGHILATSYSSILATLKDSKKIYSYPERMETTDFDNEVTKIIVIKDLVKLSDWDLLKDDQGMQNYLDAEKLLLNFDRSKMKLGE